MAIEFRLTLAGDIPLDQVAEIAAPEATEKPVPPGYSQLFSADLYEQCGYAVSITGGSHGYYDAEADDGSRWEWEPGTYVNVGFRMRADDMGDKGIPNMLATVARVLWMPPTNNSTARSCWCGTT
ncbi:SitI3 family protein [Micromonospora sp. HUAS LYJ1]|uniref:SitI3 family protein n=1 Tax=Micromonospora sp. HUAS LYJ1 TaxID=3061626 RepID=UPI002672AA6F|nr:SitI3 family protein [Micromonospora sp. HUAS LYJ1]WKU02997.1 SitI3 family protein [Micromonospora sp. HUAS LYJ1]